MTVGEILYNTRLRHEPAPLDAELLLSFVLRKSREYLFTHPEKELSGAQIAKFGALAQRRQKGEPVAYILGKKEFFGLEFLVGKNVLVPRPETELLVEKALSQILNTKYQTLDTVIDVGTGSGNIIISIIKNIPDEMRKKINFYSVDISSKALNIARKNAEKHKVKKYIKFVKTDLLGYFIKKKLKLENLLIVANLPYVSHKLYRKNLANLKFEPKNALVSSENGLSRYKKMFSQIKKFIQIADLNCRQAGCKSQITLLLEISPEQKKSLLRVAKKEFPAGKIKFHKDLCEKIRILEFTI